MQRTGKQDEAYALAQEVAALEPTDDNSLQALTILYREMHRRKLFPLPLLEIIVIYVLLKYVGPVLLFCFFLRNVQSPEFKYGHIFKRL